MFGGLFFLSSWGVVTFSNLIYSILMIFSVPDASIGGVQVLFGCQKQQDLPFGFGLL
jgi:hypothetical protein